MKDIHIYIYIFLETTYIWPGLFGRWMAVKVEQLLQVLRVTLPVHHEKVEFPVLRAPINGCSCSKDFYSTDC